MFARNRGFTLIEAVTCLLLLAVLLAVAVPAWSNALARTHAMSARSALLASLQASITHSAIAGAEVVLCPSSDSDCDDGWDWSGGWIAYADLDGDRRHDANETLLHRQPALDDDVRLLTSKGRKRLVFQPNGGNAGSNVTFTLCAGSGPARTSTLVLSNRGQLRTAPASAKQAAACRG